MNKTDINKLRRKLLEEIGDDIKKRVYVKRYISYLRLELGFDKDIEKHGTSVWTENATQRFIKTHPSVDKKLEIAVEIERMETLLGISPVIESPPEKTATKKSGLI